MDMVLHLAAIHQETGKLIHIGLKPDCFLETTKEVIDFFEADLDSACCQCIYQHCGYAPHRSRPA